MPATKKIARRMDFSTRTLAEQVADAMPIARALLVEGIDSDPQPNRNLVDDVLALAVNAQLDRWNAPDAGEATHTALYDGLIAARAIGIALGLLLRPEAFGSGGER